MDIRKCLPFDCCENCEKFILKVNEQAIFTEDRRIENVIGIHCKNEKICKRLKQELKNEN